MDNVINLKGEYGGEYYIKYSSDRVEAGGIAFGCQWDLYSFNIVCGKWTTGSSTCLPSDIELAIEYSWLLEQALACVKDVMKEG